ncbi:polysaccharide deacetylase family protein [Gammaproteobacteria bacterium]|nr:polysaccharide deacetylase family protein [Gammaproteobacteria bacterium]
MGKLIFTMSWDDGSKSDLRLAELLAKYSIESTFYIPQRNIEGIPVIDEHEIRLISQTCEVGGHSLDHIRLNKLSPEDQNYQVSQSKDWLENVIGEQIYGFCYPGGKYNSITIKAVRKAGYYYARTTENFQTEIIDKFQMPTTMQFYGHNSHILYLNMLKSHNRFTKFANYFSSISANKLSQRLEIILYNAIESNQKYLHIWGHSWELDQLNMWGELENFLKLVQQNSGSIAFKTNYQCAIASNEKKISDII